MENKINGCAFSGHREIKIRNTALGSKIIDKIFELTKRGCEDFYVGGALGFDMLAAIMLVSLKKKGYNLKIHFILPCPDYRKKWKPYYNELMDTLLSHADEIVYVSECFGIGCMQKRNRYLIDNTDVLIAYLRKECGGTYYTYGYAKNKNKEIILL